MVLLVFLVLFLGFVAIMFLSQSISADNAARREDKDQQRRSNWLSLEGCSLSGVGQFLYFTEKPFSAEAKAKQFTICKALAASAPIAESQIEAFVNYLPNLNYQPQLLIGFGSNVFYPSEVGAFSTGILCVVEKSTLVKPVFECLSSGGQSNYQPLVKLDCGPDAGDNNSFISLEVSAIFEHGDHALETGRFRIYLSLPEDLPDLQSAKEVILEKYKLLLFGEESELAELSQAVFALNAARKWSQNELDNSLSKLMQIQDYLRRASASPSSSSLVPDLSAKLDDCKTTVETLTILERDLSHKAIDAFNSLLCANTIPGRIDVTAKTASDYKELINSAREIYAKAMSMGFNSSQ